LMSDHGRIPSNWLEERVKRVERLDGDIDVLMARIASVRTWTYVAHQATWLEDALGWQERTRTAEEKLSNALHNKLTQRFVDKRTSQLVKTLKDGDALDIALFEDGRLDVEGHTLGTLNGFRFVAAESESTLAAKVLDSAANKALRSKIIDRIAMLKSDADTAFTFDSTGKVLWRSEPIAQICKGSNRLAPTVKSLTSDLLETAQKETIEARLNQWLKDLIKDRLGLLLAASSADLNGVARGLVFQLSESLGALPRHEADAEIKGLEREDRQALRRLGVRLGRHLIYIPNLLRPAPVELSVLLWALFEEVEPLGPPPAGRVSLKREKHEPEGWLRAAGFRPAGKLFIRADMLERMAELAWKRLEDAKGPFVPNEDFLALAGCGVDELPPILQTLGFAPTNEDGKWQPKGRGKGNAKGNVKAQGKDRPKHAPKKGPKTPAQKAKAKPQEVKIDPDNPFAMLQQLKLKK
ncbi:MAG: disulfide oxidoreductase, partial [Magnetovibrio sp.]|nr:disulfide oxidoreductase [Magnetovibrio sp.]